MSRECDVDDEDEDDDDDDDDSLVTKLFVLMTS